MSILEEFPADRCLHSNVRGLGPSATVAINERCDRMRREGRRVYKLGLGQSPFPVPPPVVEELRANAHRKEYLPVAGLGELRAAVADYHRRANGIPARPEGVIVGPGSKELMFLLQICFDGDLLIPTPAWVSYAPQARIAGRQVRFLPARAEDGWRLDPERLDALCAREGRRPRILVLNYPSNPTGATYAAAELEALAAVAQRRALVLLSDEIYGELHHEGRHVSLARFYPEGTIVSSGISKWCGAGGWRLGTFAFPAGLDFLREAIAAAASETYTSTSAPIQYAAVRAFEPSTRIERYLWLVRRILGPLGRDLAERLRRAGARVETPAGAFYLWADFSPLAERLRARGIEGGRALCERLLEETGVAVLPAVDFGRDPGELAARIAYVDFDGARALAAAETLPRDAPLGRPFLEAYAGNVIEAIDRLCAWLAEGGAGPA